MNFLTGKRTVLAGLTALIMLIFLVSSFFYGYYQRRQKQRLEKLNAKAQELTITIIEGWNTAEIGKYLEKEGIVNEKNFLTAERNFKPATFDFLKTLPSDADLEGFLFPDTYRILKSTAELAKTNPQLASKTIIKKILDNTQVKLDGLKIDSGETQGLPLFGIITLASIVEKETGRNSTSAEQKQQLQEERQTIAGIFLNRLKAGMPLESDATINYITGKNNPQPSAVDLSINSPYNTYKNQGLPKGPICNPSLSSIEAVLKPIKTDYFYFLHQQPSGEVVYSKTFKEHVRNKQKYLK
jgi:UPF0755 protein